MSLIKFLTSKIFFKQLALAAVALLVLSFIILKWLKITTNHNQFETVPDLKGKSIEVAKIALKDNKLAFKLQDSANYNPDYPPKSVIDQDPKAGAKVKENRKIYLTLNPSGYRDIPVPDLKERTIRQARATLRALGFQVGNTSYIDNIAKDVVLQMKHKGETLEAGTLLKKMSKIDLVLGNGNEPSLNNNPNEQPTEQPDGI